MISLMMGGSCVTQGPKPPCKMGPGYGLERQFCEQLNSGADERIPQSMCQDIHKLLLQVKLLTRTTFG